MQEGIILCFHQEQLVDKTYTIPIYLVEESGLKNSHLSLKEDYQEWQRFATLPNKKNGSWNWIKMI